MLSQGAPTNMIEKIFKAYDVRATYPNPLNEEMAWRVGHATGQYLKRSRQGIPADQRVRNEGSMIVGRDMRPSSRDLAKALTDGIRSTGMNVIDIGMVDTSSMVFRHQSPRLRRRRHDHRLAQSHQLQRLQDLRAQGQAHRRASRPR
jgi:phosphomannomutase